MALPTKLITVALTFVSVTPAPTLAPSAGVAKTPALRVKVTVNVSFSVSAKVAADKSTLLRVSSVTVTSEGEPVMVGAAFNTLSLAESVLLEKALGGVTEQSIICNPPVLSAT